MAVELVEAYISLIPSMRGAGKTIGRELGSSEVQGEVENAGRKSGGGWVKGMGKVLGGAALAGVGIAAGMAIKGGLDRALSVENAEAKLTGLGHSADGVARIMDDALKSVKGTAFGMGEAATTAAGAVAAGVKPGADLERTLKLVADAATIAGTDMGSMGAIFNKVGASNKIQGDVIAQLGDQGIPILQFLAAEMGVTAEAAADMASKGQVDFDTFRNAMETGLGGAALASGETTQGAMKNMMASLSRAGESFLSGVFPMFKDGFTGITGFLDNLGPIAEKAGQWFGSALTSAKDAFASLFDLVVKGDFTTKFRETFNMDEDSGVVTFLLNMRDTAITVFNEVKGGIAAFVAAFQDGGSDITSSGFAGVLEGLGLAARATFDYMTGTVVPAIAGVVQEFKDGEGAGGLLRDVISGIGTAVKNTAEWLLDHKVLLVGVAGAYVAWKLVMAGIAFAAWVAGVWRITAGWVANTRALLANKGAMLASKAESVALVAMYAGSFVANVVRATVAWVSNTAALVANKVATFAKVSADKALAIGSLIAANVRSTAVWVAQTASIVANRVAVFAVAAGQRAMAVAQGIATAAQWAFNAALNANPIGLIVLAIASLVGAFVWFFTQTEIGQKIVQVAWGAIKAAISAVASWWTGTAWPAIKAVIDWFGAAFQVAGMIISTAWSGIQAAIGAVWAWVRDNVFVKIQWWIDVIKIAFGFYRDAIVSAWNAVKDGLATGWQWISTNVFEPLKAGVSLIGDAFENVKDAIGTSWDALKSIAAKPVNFILGTVYNDGIREWWNKISGAVGLDSLSLPRASLVKFASGGVLPGYTPGRDVHQFYSPTGGRLALSGGEAIMRPEFTRAVGGAAGVARLNAAARGGQSLAFAGGGVWDFFGDAWDTVKGVGKGIWDAAGMAVEVVKDPIGAIKKAVVDGIIHPLMSKVGVGGDFVKVLTELPVKWAGGLADKVKSMFAAQESTMANGTPGNGVGLGMMGQMLQAILPGARVTSGFRAGARTAGFGAVSFHALGRALDIGAGGGRSLSQIWDVINAAYGSQSQELLYTPKGANQILRGGKRGGTSGVTAKNHYDHVHWVMANGGVIPGLYDNGGWIPDGGMALNLSGRPEAVLDPEESAALKNGLHNQGPLVNQIIVRDEREAVRELESLRRRQMTQARLGVLR